MTCVFIFQITFVNKIASALNYNKCNYIHLRISTTRFIAHSIYTIIYNLYGLSLCTLMVVHVMVVHKNSMIFWFTVNRRIHIFICGYYYIKVFS